MYRVTYMLVKGQIYNQEFKTLQGAEKFIELLKNSKLLKHIYPINKLS